VGKKELSRDEKIARLLALKELKRRQLAAKPRFEPHAGQRRVISSQALERYLFCGNGYGKSTILVNEVHWAATGFNPITGEKTPVPAKIVLLLDSPEKIEDFITEYRKWNKLEPEQLHKRGKPHVSFIDYDTGSTVTVISHQVEPLKLEGSQWTHIFMDEPPPKPVFTALFRGGRIKGRPCRVLLAGTPITAAWLRTDVYEPWARGETPLVECFTGNTEENRSNLETGYIERFAAKLSEQEKKVRLQGAFHDLEGLALSHLFREDTHVIQPADLNWDLSWPCVVAIDPHPSKKHRAVLVGADRDNRLVVLKEIARKETPRQFARTLKQWYAEYRICDIICDSLGSADMTGGEGFKSFIQVLNEEGVRARATSYKEKEDEAFISRIQDALLLPEEPDSFNQRVPKLRVVSTCTETISDIRNVQWARDRGVAGENKPKLEISNRDMLACVKYALATNLYNTKAKDTSYHVTQPLYGYSPRRQQAYGGRDGKIRLRSSSYRRRRPVA
jgi:hypothetical protein